MFERSFLGQGPPVVYPDAYAEYNRLKSQYKEAVEAGDEEMARFYQHMAEELLEGRGDYIPRRISDDFSYTPPPPPPTPTPSRIRQAWPYGTLEPFVEDYSDPAWKARYDPPPPPPTPTPSRIRQEWPYGIEPFVEDYSDPAWKARYDPTPTTPMRPRNIPQGSYEPTPTPRTTYREQGMTPTCPPGQFVNPNYPERGCQPIGGGGLPGLLNTATAATAMLAPTAMPATSFTMGRAMLGEVKLVQRGF